MHEIPGFKSHSGPPFIFYFSTFLLFPMASSFFRNKAHLTPDELAARMDGYVVAGLESEHLNQSLMSGIDDISAVIGVRKEVVGKCFNSLKGKVCTIIVECFCAFDTFILKSGTDSHTIGRRHLHSEGLRSGQAAKRHEVGWIPGSCDKVRCKAQRMARGGWSAQPWRLQVMCST